MTNLYHQIGQALEQDYQSRFIDLDFIKTLIEVLHNNNYLATSPVVGDVFKSDVNQVDLQLDFDCLYSKEAAQINSYCQPITRENFLSLINFRVLARILKELQKIAPPCPKPPLNRAKALKEQLRELQTELVAYRTQLDQNGRAKIINFNDLAKLRSMYQAQAVFPFDRILAIDSRKFCYDVATEGTKLQSNLFLKRHLEVFLLEAQLDGYCRRDGTKIKAPLPVFLEQYAQLLDQYPVLCYEPTQFYQRVYFGFPLLGKAPIRSNRLRCRSRIRR